MDIDLVLSLIINGQSLPDGQTVRDIVRAIQYEPQLVYFQHQQTLDSIELSTLIENLCQFPDFNNLPAGAKTLLMTLWSFVRRRITSISVHGNHKHSLMDLALVEIIHCHLMKSHMQSLWVRNIITWFTLVHNTEEEVIGVASQSMQDYLEVISNGDLASLRSMVATISPFFTLPALNGWSLLHFTCSISEQTFRMRDIIDILVQAGVSISTVDGSGCTALHIAAQHFNHAAIVALSKYPQLLGSVKDKNGRTALDTLANTVARRKVVSTISDEQMVALIKFLLPNNEISALWTLWDVDSSSDPNCKDNTTTVGFRRCPIYYFATGCSETVSADLLVFCSTSAMKYGYSHQQTIIQILQRCIATNKLRLFLKLSHLYLKIDNDAERKQAHQKGENMEFERIQERLNRFVSLLVYFNLLMVIACRNGTLDVRRLLLEVWWTEIVRQLSTHRYLVALVTETNNFPLCKTLFLSRYHAYANCDDTVSLQHELKSVPPVIADFIVLNDKSHSEVNCDHSIVSIEFIQHYLQEQESNLKFLELYTVLEETFINSNSNLKDSCLSSMMQYSLLAWSGITHAPIIPSSANTTSSISNLETSEQSPQSTTSVLEILLRRLFVSFGNRFDAEIESQLTISTISLISQSLFWALFSANQLSLAKWLSLLGPESFVRWLSTRSEFLSDLVRVLF
jgi:ankyrin repeat protein